MPAGQVAPGTPRVLAAAPFVPAAPPADAASSWRRLSLAKWMTAPENPLVARVAANRVWQALFGEGLVSTENDFGLMGAYPVYPALLDWLAATLRDSGWKLKPLIRAIVLSDVYGQSSAVNPAGERIDAANRLLWRYPLRRLDAEAFRDSLLFASGALNRQMHGPGVYPKIAREVLEGQSRPGDGWGAYDETAAARRSIYVFVKRSLLVPEMDVLDFADTTTSCEQRPVSTIATQALTLLNGEFVNQQAARLAARVAGAAGRDPVAQVTWSFRWALGRDPTSSERQEALQFLARAGGASEEAGTSALTALARVLFNSNEFSHVD